MKLNRISYIFLVLAILFAFGTDVGAAQFARPDGTNAAGTWTFSGAASLHEAIDETTANDETDYIEDAGGDVAEFSLGDVTDPLVGSGHILRMWMRSSGSGGGERCGIELFQGTTSIASLNNQQNRAGTYLEVDMTLTALEADSITDYNDLRIQVSVAGLSGADFLRITMIELEVPDAAGATAPIVILPTVDLVDTTGATLGATVNSDGGDPLLSRGTVWDTTALPTANPAVEGGTSVGDAYEHGRINMYEGSLIYYRGYAINLIDTGYSIDDSFYTEPVEASGIGFANVTDIAMRITWAAGTSDATYGSTVSSTVVVREVGAVDFVPGDGSTYSANTTFGSGTPLGPTTDNYVVYNGTGTQVDIIGLSADTTYYVAVYAHVGPGTMTNYQQDSVPTSSQKTDLSVVAPTLISLTMTGIDTTSATLGATVDTDGGDAIISRGTVWDTSATPRLNLSAQGGTALDEAYFHLRTSLYEGTLIYFAGYASNNTTTGYSSDGSFYTESGQASTMGFENVGDTAMRITWTAGTSDGTYGSTVSSTVIVREVGAVDFVPGDGSTYSADSIFGNGTPLGPTTDNYVVYNGTGSQADITGLAADTLYYVAVYAHVGSGSSTNYQHDGEPTGSQQTNTAAVLATLVSPLATAIETTSATLGATISNDGGGSILERGTVWDTTSAPTANDEDEGGTSVSVPYSHNRVGLYEGTFIYYRGYADNSAGRAYSSDDSFFSEPGQAAGVGFANVNDTDMRITWTAGTSDATYGETVNMIVVIRDAGIVDFVPVEGSTYTANSNFGSGTPLGPTTDNYVVYNGTGTQVDITGLTEATAYYVAVYAYVGSPINYQQDSPATGIQITTGGAAPIPTLSLPTVSAVTATGATLGAFIDTGAPITDRGTVWGTSPGPTGNAVSESGGATTMGEFTDGRSGLTSGVLIYFAGYADNATGRGYSPDGVFYTEPDSQASSLTFPSWHNTRINLSYIRGSGDGVIVLAKQGSSVNSAPVDGVTYTTGKFGTGSEIGTGNYVIYAGPANSPSAYGLSSDTTYYFAVYEYAGSGTGESGINYLQTSPATGSQMTSPPSHNEAHGITDCLTCHSMHSGPVPRDNEQLNACVDNCHKPEQMPGSMSDVALHLADSSGTVVDCGSCHEVHAYNFDTTDAHSGGTTAANLSRIRWNTSKYENSWSYSGAALEPALFQEDPAHFAFDETTYSLGPFNGVCQSCHSRVTKHTNDAWDEDAVAAADNDHEAGNDCTGCHAHQDNFAGSGGGCTTCHDKVQDDESGPARRAIVGASGDFILTSHHIPDATVTDDDCAVCHMESEVDHKNGLIDLRDPDSGTGLTGFVSLTRNTSSNSLEPTVVDVQNNFCLKCHDNLGATASFNAVGDATHPFSTGALVPDVDGQFDTSHSFYHPVKGAGSNPFCTGVGSASTMESPWNQSDDHNQISCFDCHGVNGHGSANQRMLLTAIDFTTMEATTVEADLPAGMGATVDALCITCHKSTVYVDNGSGNSVDIGSIFEYHGAAQSQHGSGGGNELGCMGCHGGTVELHNETYSNGAARGNIHGTSFTWPAGSMSAEPTITFLLGGWIDGYKAEGQWSNKDGWWNAACGGGQCNHSGGTKYWSPVAD